jgi:hypothetical protein
VDVNNERKERAARGKRRIPALLKSYFSPKNSSRPEDILCFRYLFGRFGQSSTAARVSYPQVVQTIVSGFRGLEMPFAKLIRA